MANIRPVKAGDDITEGLLNRIVDQIERFANLKSDSPYIRLDGGPHGKVIDLDLPAPTWALLSGSSSPYSFTEVRDGPGGTWVSMANGDSGTSNVYEANGKSGLAGKVVPITWTAAGDWRFQWVGYGAVPDCDSTTTKINFTVHGCTNTPLPDASVEVEFNGSPYASGATDANGEFSVGISDFGTYSYSITKFLDGAQRYTTVTGSVVFSNCTSQNVAKQLLAATGFVCCTPATDDTREYPYSLNFLCTYPCGSEILTYNGSGAWVKSGLLFSDPDAYGCDGSGFANCSLRGTYDVAYSLLLICGSGPTNGTFGQGWKYTALCSPTLNTSTCLPSAFDRNDSASDTWVRATAFPKTFTIPSTGFSGHTTPCPGTAIVSEILP